MSWRAIVVGACKNRLESEFSPGELGGTDGPEVGPGGVLSGIEFVTGRPDDDAGPVPGGAPMGWNSFQFWNRQRSRFVAGLQMTCGVVGQGRGECNKKPPGPKAERFGLGTPPDNLSFFPAEDWKQTAED